MQITYQDKNYISNLFSCLIHVVFFFLFFLKLFAFCKNNSQYKSFMFTSLRMAVFMNAPHLHKLYTWFEAGVDLVHIYEKFGTTNIFMYPETHVKFANSPCSPFTNDVH